MNDGRTEGPMHEDQKRWDGKYLGKTFDPARTPHPFLRRHLRLLPRGTALDVAAGEGRNAVFLAEHGFKVEAVDISPVGLRRARMLARARGVKIKTTRANLAEYPLERDHFDLIIDFYYLDRALVPGIKNALKTGGRVVFETYTTDHKRLAGSGPENPDYLLRPNELLRLFRGFRVLFYREGIFREGRARKGIASLIAEKNAPSRSPLPRTRGRGPG